MARGSRALLRAVLGEREDAPGTACGPGSRRPPTADTSVAPPAASSATSSPTTQLPDEVTVAESRPELNNADEEVRGSATLQALFPTEQRQREKDRKAAGLAPDGKPRRRPQTATSLRGLW